MHKLMVAGLVFSVSLIAQNAAQNAAPEAARGKELYVKYSCYACHSFDGHGGAGARLVPMKLLLPVFIAYVRAPRAMPAYREKTMSNAELADVWAYLKTIPESPPAKSIPLLRDLEDGR
jgi:mono/diheme cytochrome c family protein